MTTTATIIGGTFLGATGSKYASQLIDEGLARYVYKSPNISKDAFELQKTVVNAAKEICNRQWPVSMSGLAGLGVGLVTLKVALEKWFGSAEKNVV